MSSEPQSPNAYDAVLADLHAQRDKIDQAISLLSALRGGAAPKGVMSVTASEPAILETAGMFLGMSIVEASKKLLGMRKRTMGNPEIAKELQAGGLVLNSKEPANVIGSVLTRRFNEVGDLVKVGRGIWGLKEWYPGRTFKPATKASDRLAAAIEESEAPSYIEPNPDDLGYQKPNAVDEFDALLGGPGESRL